MLQHKNIHKEKYGQAALSLSIRLRFRSCSSIISRSAAVIGADRFFSFSALSPLSEEAPADLNTFGRLRGLAFKGFTAAFSGFILKAVGAAGAATGLADSDSTTFSEFSSRFNPASTGGDDGPASALVSAAALSICSAISCRSRASSEIVALSFFCAASWCRDVDH